jgi:hypothetical protein
MRRCFKQNVVCFVGATEASSRGSIQATGMRRALPAISRLANPARGDRVYNWQQCVRTVPQLFKTAISYCNCTSTLTVSRLRNGDEDAEFHPLRDRLLPITPSGFIQTVQANALTMCSGSAMLYQNPVPKATAERMSSVRC